MGFAFALISWDPRPAYVPKRLRNRWDYTRLSHYWKSYLRKRYPYKDCFQPRQLCSYLTTALSSQDVSSRSFRTDSDSFLIAIDNCASYSMTLDISDFLQPPKPLQSTITGIGGGHRRHTSEPSDGKLKTTKVSHATCSYLTHISIQKAPSGFCRRNTMLNSVTKSRTA